MTLPFIWDEMVAVLRFIGAAFVHLLPFLALSVPLSVVLKHSGASNLIKAKLGKNQIVAVVLATFIGAVSPLCSCGVIPIIAALLTSGVPLAPVMSFWLASPSMDPEILFLSAGSIGWPLAVWRLAATFVMSLGAGLTVIALEKRKAFGNDYLKAAIIGPNTLEKAHFKPVKRASCECSAPSLVAEPACCRAENDSTRDQGTNRLSDFIVILKESAGTAVTLSLWMLLAFLLEALISRYFPTAAVAALLGKDAPWAIPLATTIGVPLYTTNLTALGIVGGLLSQGMSGGAALAFLIGGAVTTIPAMSAVWGIVKPRVFLAYLGFALAGSLLAGYGYQIVSTIVF